MFEAGARVGASVREWGHVRVFSPWGFNIDPAAERLLDAAGWERPEADGYPTGDEIVERYLEPLAALPQIAERLRFGARVRRGRQARRRQAQGRRARGGAVRARGRPGRVERRRLGAAVIDASGTWTLPNPLGAGGAARGRRARARDRIAYGIPDVLGRERDRYAGRRVLVVGSGHSAFNAILDLVALRDSEPRDRDRRGRSGAARPDASTAAAAMTSCRPAARSAPPCAGSSRTARRARAGFHTRELAREGERLAVV